MPVNICIFRRNYYFCADFKKPELGDRRFPILLTVEMLEKAKIVELVNEKLDEQMFLVDVQVTAANVVRVFIDSFDGITIDRCVAVSRHIEHSLDRENEDFELQVSSPGLSETFKVKEQYLKNAGRQIEILTENDEKITGLLKEALPEHILLETSSREKLEGNKKKQLVVREHQIKYGDIKSAKVVVSFK
jgi:ribosome maturation factor RimP